jgi:cation transporter-like permease
MSLLGLIGLLLLFGLVAYLVRAAPFVDARFKQIAVFVLLVVAAIVVLGAFGVVDWLDRPVRVRLR